MENNTDLVRYDGGLSSWSPGELREMVSQEIELRRIVVDYYRSQMLADKHFYTLQGAAKPALSKEGALNLCSLFKVRVSADDPVETYHSDGHYTVRYRIHLISTRNGEIVADGDGSCSTRESKYAYRWVKEGEIPGSLDKTTLSKRSNRYGTQYRIPHQDLADHYNTVLKMAYKRSIVAASLCLPLVSELFTQDIEEEHIRGAALENQGGSQQIEQNPPSQRQIAFARDLLERAGHDETSIERIVSGVNSREDASELINRLRNGSLKDAAPPETPQNRPSGLVQAWDAETQEWVNGPAKQHSNESAITDDQVAKWNAEIDADGDEWEAEDRAFSEEPIKPVRPGQRGKLIGMFKQLGVRDGDKRKLFDLLNLNEKTAQDLEDEIVAGGADSLPWEVLKVYIGMLKKRTGKTNEDIIDYCSSVWDKRHPKDLNREGRTAFFEWLAEIAKIESQVSDTETNEDEAMDDMAAWIEGAKVSSEMLAKMTDEEIQRAIGNWKKRAAANG